MSDNNNVSFSIRIVNEDGEGIPGVTVAVDYVLGGEREETDDDGWAHFTTVVFLMTSVKVSEIRARGTVLDEDITVDDGETLSYTLTDG